MKYWQFYKERIPELPEPNEKGESVVKCVFHEDGNPSLAVNVDSGKWKCYTPSCVGHTGGGWKKFETLLKGEGPMPADIKVPPIDDAAIAGFHQVLLKSKHPLEILHGKRGLSDATIARFTLGFDGDRILIPVRGPDGSWVNVRKYKYGAAKDKMIAWGPRYNRARLFPFDVIATSEWLLLCEGETDTMLMCQLGYPAITATGGADTWMPEFNTYLKGKRVIVCYDADPAGKKGARQVANQLAGSAAEVRVLTLPLAGSKEEKDLTDYFVTLGHTKEEFDALIEAAEPVEQLVKKEAPPAELEEIHLSQIGVARLVGKRVKVTALVAGKDLSPYVVPGRIAYSCASVGGFKECTSCGICKANGQLEVVVPTWSQDVLQMVNVPNEKLVAHIARMAEIPYGCRRSVHEVKETLNVEAIKVIPEIDFNAGSSPYVIRALYNLGHGIEANRTYRIEAVVMPDPKDQSATALISSAEASIDSIEQFTPDATLDAQLSIFKVTQ